MAKFYCEKEGYGKFKFYRVFPIYGKIPKGKKVFNNSKEAEEFAKQKNEEGNE